MTVQTETMPEKKSMAKKKLPLLIRILLIVLGSLSLALGIIGILLPVLPTTPFLIVSAALFIRSSDRLYNWLFANKVTGPRLRKIREQKGLTLGSKIFFLAVAWVALIAAAIFVADSLVMRIVFPGIALIKTILFFTVIKTV